MKKARKYLALLLALACILAVFTACGSANTPAGTSETPSAPESAAGASTGTPADKHLTVALGYFGDGLDPIQSWNGWTLARTAIGESLVKLDANMQITGVIADSWKNVDATTWSFHIRDGVTFQNGNPVTAEAVKASLDRALKECDRAVSLLPVAEITASGQDLTIKMSEPYGATLGNLADPVFTIIDTSVDLTNVNTAPVCTGPFEAVSYTKDQTIEVKAYKNYWGGASPLSTVTYKLIKDGDTLSAALQSGEIDVGQSLSQTALPLFTNNSAYTVSVVPSTRTALIWLNYGNPFLSDANVRKALAYSLNREDLAKTLLGGSAATGAFSSALPFGNDGLTAYSYDTGKAKQLLADGGYKDSNGDSFVDKDGKNIELKLVIKKGTDNSTLASYLQAAFSAIGIKVNIELYDDVLTAMADKSVNFDIGVGNINTGTTGDPQYFLELYFKTGASENYGGYSNKDLDALMGKLSTEMDTTARCDIAAQAQQLILNDSPYLFLTYTNNNAVSKSSVKGIQAYPIDYYLMTNKVDIG
ncbi:peptide/nickel transport system substrate-binding protein [Sporobacter termitidis DSM 10068]|uniref:Peptide/nickel transport system substrate-binding protein n=1 Tax=Sporobacter termitidis DSM 10068 TaxID=1123282 RepID=A0A1M5XDN2_9FIRM|nr:ABC transporter substrate-binding protein [Sporobacter termitidis]SHH97648.1 peptide/nickel transport system substrate-binding protein [Sporobacter termitidis DSM 10068]